MEYLIVFKNTNHAIKAENTLLKGGVAAGVTPLPTQIRAGCGISLRVNGDRLKEALGLLAGDGVGETEVYVKESEGRYKKYQSLTDDCTSGGCGAKIEPGALSALLKGLPAFSDPNLLVGYDSSDDAAVYRLDEARSIVTTVDFFSPMIDDGRAFGRIAAANALSDVYAMGGRPVTALNIVCFPQSAHLGTLAEIMGGGSEKVAEAGAILAGGHSIYAKEPKYGLAVTGIVETDKIIRNNTPKIGHKLILTKPLGVGIIMAAHRGGLASREAVDKAVGCMERLNRYAAEKMIGCEVSACTDITGFGLAAHMLEMAGDKVSFKIDCRKLPYIEEAYAYAKEYLLTAAGQRNRNYAEGKINIKSLPFPLQEIIFDPQTSGGLLICVAAEQAESLLVSVRKDDPEAGLIGEVAERGNETILFG